MKKFVLLISFAVYGIVAMAQEMLKSPVSAQSQVTPPAQIPPLVDVTPNVQATRPIVQQSPNMVKTAYLTNLTCKTMQAYPNPATDHVLIQHMSTSERAVITIVSTDGQIMQQRTVLPNTYQTELGISRLTKGIYILKFDDGRGDVRTLKLVKN
jgi:hypothetical protein